MCGQEEKHCVYKNTHVKIISRIGNAEDKEKKSKRIEVKIINTHSQTQMLSLPLEMM